MIKFLEEVIYSEKNMNCMAKWEQKGNGVENHTYTNFKGL